MIIKELTLVNFKSHKNSTIKFNDGISVILGQNGAGKSTLFEAIRFALFKKVDGNIADLIRKPAYDNDDVSTMKVKLNFKHNHIDYELERVRKKSSSSSKLIRFSSGKMIQTTTGEKDVTREIEEIIGVDKDSFLNAVYIQQGEITSLIDKTAGDRKELISKLLNLDNLEKSWKNMADIVKEYEAKKEFNDKLLDEKEKILLKQKENEESFNKVTEEITEDEKLKDELEANVKTLAEEVKELDNKKEKFEKNNVKIESIKQSINETTQQLNNEETHLKEIEAKEEENKIIEQETTKLQLLKDLVEIKNKYDDKKTRLIETEEKINKVNRWNETLKNTKDDYEKSIEYNKQLEEVNKQQESLKSDVEELKNLKSTLNALENNKKELANKIGKKANDARSILNNNTLRNEEEITSEYNRQLKDNEEKQEILNKKIKEYQLKISSNNTIIKNTKKSLTDLKNTTDKCPICQSDISHEKHQSLQDEYETTIRKCEEESININEKIKDSDEKLNDVNKKIKEIRKIEIQSIVDDYNKFKNDIDDIKKINEKIAALDDKDNQYQENDTKIHELSDKIKTLEENRQAYITATTTLKEFENIEELESKKSSLNEEIALFKNQITDISRKVQLKDDINVQIKYLEEREKRYNENKGFISNKEDTHKKIDAMNNLLTKNNNNLDYLNRENRELSYDEEKHKKCNDEYTSSNEKLIEIGKKLVENNTRIEGLKQEKIDIDDNLKNLEKIEKQQEALDDYIKLLTNIRQLYGKDGVQKTLRESSKPQIEIETNHIFNEFNFDYDNIQLDENYEITIKKSNEVLNVSMLSGGEKIVVALALRLAIAEVISKQKNELLILDEPTVHLDEERKLELIEILRNSNIAPQMFIVTHDPELINISENVIEIRKNNGISTYQQN